MADEEVLYYVLYSREMERKRRLRRIRRRFMEAAGMPGVIGAVDGTHIAIVPPSADREHNFINRKNFHSKNACDYNLKITAIHAGYGGKTHDATVWRDSMVQHCLQLDYVSGERNKRLLEKEEESEISDSEAPAQSERKYYICNVCNKSFLWKCHLGRHVRVHYNERPYKCSECDKTFKQASVKIRHVLGHLKERKNYRSQKKGSIKKPYSCEICKKEFSNQNSLHNHSNLHKNKYSCSFCGKSLSSNSALNDHLRIHSSVKPFPCKVCRKCFTRKDNLKNHMATHSQDRPFKCNECDKRFKTQNTKSEHELLHLRSKVEDSSGNIYLEKGTSEILKENPEIKDTSDKVYDKAGTKGTKSVNKFQKKSHLGQHVRVHYNERPYKCSECDKTFKQSSGKRRHVLRHLKDRISDRSQKKGGLKKPYSCEICKKEFSCQKSIWHHSNLHKNKFSCSLCGKGFSSNSNLNNHLRIHSNEKPFDCKVCKRCFTLKAHLKRHMATHSQD
ncbi:hypothetical protein J437_LFUL013333, partial [Ladona fulva]